MATAKNNRSPQLLFFGMILLTGATMLLLVLLNIMHANSLTKPPKKVEDIPDPDRYTYSDFPENYLEPLSPVEPSTKTSQSKSTHPPKSKSPYTQSLTLLTKMILDEASCDLAEVRAFDFFQEHYPQLLKFLKTGGFQTPKEKYGVPYIQGHPPDKCIQSWNSRFYRDMRQRDPKPTRQEHYQLFGEHLALAAWWISQKSPEERLAGISLAGTVIDCARRHLSDDALIAEISIHLTIPHLHYAGKTSRDRHGSQGTLWSAALRAYWEINQGEGYITACEKMIQLNLVSDIGDVARLRLGKMHEKRGEIAKAIKALKSIHPGGSIREVNGWILRLEKKLPSHENKNNNSTTPLE